MEIKKVKQGYKLFLQSVELLMKSLDSSFLDALIEAGDNLNEGQIMVENGRPTATERQKLQTTYLQFNQLALTPEQKRQVLQFALFRAQDVDKIQANHQLTPDAIAVLLAEILNNFLLKTKPAVIIDPTVGTGNLLFAIDQFLSQKGFTALQYFGIDNDDTLLGIASMSAKMLQVPVELYHQDAIDPWITPKADVILTDLPVGYYPLDRKAKNFASKAVKGHSFIHHLLIEQSLLQLKPNGLGIFLVPKVIFQTSETKGLLEVIRTNAHFQGLLNLPQDLFASAKSQKALLILQKKGDQAQQAAPVLIGEFPAVKENADLVKFTSQIRNWQKKNLFY
jgi:site-specific DNA-methyltransferase (adenine-specific)